MTDDVLGGVIASTPYLLGYHPHDGVAAHRLVYLEEGSLHLVATAFIPHDPTSGPFDDRRAASVLRRGMGEMDAMSMTCLVSYTDSPEASTMGEAVGAHLRGDYGVGQVRSFVVSGDQYAPTTPGEARGWVNLPAPLPAVVESHPSPAPSRDSLLDQVSPYPEPTYRWISGQELEFFRTMPPEEAAAHITTTLDHPGGLTPPAGAGRAGQVAYLFTRDTPTRDVTLARLAAASAPARDAARLHNLIDITRGCPDPIAQQHLYANTAFTSYVLGSRSIDTDALLRQVTAPISLAQTITIGLEKGAPGRGLKAFIAKDWPSKEFRSNLTQGWQPPPPHHVNPARPRSSNPPSQRPTPPPPAPPSSGPSL